MVPCGRAIAQRIKGTPGITGLFICARYVPAAELDAMVAWVLRGQRVIIEIEPISIAKVGAGWM